MSNNTCTKKNANGVNYISKYGKYYGKELMKLASKGYITLMYSDVNDYIKLLHSYDNTSEEEKLLNAWELDYSHTWY